MGGRRRFPASSYSLRAIRCSARLSSREGPMTVEELTTQILELQAQRAAVRQAIVAIRMTTEKTRCAREEGSYLSAVGTASEMAESAYRYAADAIEAALK